MLTWSMCKPHISIEDTFNHEQVKLYLPLTSCILTGDYDHVPIGNKEIRSRGYFLLASKPFYLRHNCVEGA